MTNDPFAFDDPDEIPSEFASLDSFRGRLVLITPTDFDPDAKNDNGVVTPKFTATITTVDGKGPVRQYVKQIPTEAFFEGPRHEGVWLSQGRIVKGLQSAWARKGSVLARPETYRPGKPAGKGNPWGLLPATDAEKKQAREFLATLTIESASEPAEEESPF